MPGSLYNGLTFEEAMQGHSKLRNRAIANVFSQIGLIEAWGTGLQRIQTSAREYGLPEPEFIEMPETFRVNLFRKQLLAENRKVDGDNFGDDGKKDGESTAKFGESSVKSSVKLDDKSIATRIDTSTNTKTDTNINNDTEGKILALIQQKPESTLEDMMNATGLSKSGVRYALSRLRESGKVTREGTRKNGKWVIIQ